MSWKASEKGNEIVHIHRDHEKYFKLIFSGFQELEEYPHLNNIAEILFYVLY
jgi:hypothetical protein